MLEYDVTFDDPEEPKISSYEYNVIYIALFDRIEKDIKKVESQLKYAKEEYPYLKKHYQQQLTELMNELESIKKARTRAYEEE